MLIQPKLLWSIAGSLSLLHYAVVIAASDGSAGQQTLDAKFLLEMGQTYNNPMLKLIGRAVLNGEKALSNKLCKMHPCTDWSDWTACSVVTGFGMMTRSRECNKTTDMCKYDPQTEYTSNESKICEGDGYCPHRFTNVSGFCLGYFATPMNQGDAEAECVKTGGHLVNINTRAMSEAVHGLLKDQGYTGTIWINGYRTSTAAAWDYTYGAPPDFDNWASNEPSNASTELCKVDENNLRRWCDRGCHKKYHFICHI